MEALKVEAFRCKNIISKKPVLTNRLALLFAKKLQMYLHDNGGYDYVMGA